MQTQVSQREAYISGSLQERNHRQGLSAIAIATISDDADHDQPIRSAICMDQGWDKAPCTVMERGPGPQCSARCICYRVRRLAPLRLEDTTSVFAVAAKSILKSLLNCDRVTRHHIYGSAATRLSNSHSFALRQVRFKEVPSTQ